MVKNGPIAAGRHFFRGDYESAEAVRFRCAGVGFQEVRAVLLPPGLIYIIVFINNGWLAVVDPFLGKCQPGLFGLFLSCIFLTEGW
jgi:hypothetical protein